LPSFEYVVSTYYLFVSARVSSALADLSFPVLRTAEVDGDAYPICSAFGVGSVADELADVGWVFVVGPFVVGGKCTDWRRCLGEEGEFLSIRWRTCSRTSRTIWE
jgi:hypothetical protein